MKMLTQEWVKKAENDWLSLNHEMKRIEDTNYDDACFHAQQCAEKYLKAFLQEASVRFNKVHDLIALLDLALPFAPAWNTLRPALNVLNPYTIEIRYPGHTITQQNAEEAVPLCKTVCAAVRLSLGLNE